MTSQAHRPDPAPLFVESSARAETAIISATGEIDLATVEEIRQAVAAVVAAGVRDLTLDLSGVTYIDSSGLGMLVGTNRRISGAGGRFTVRGCGRRVLKLIEITGLDKVLTITRDDGSVVGA